VHILDAGSVGVGGSVGGVCACACVCGGGGGMLHLFDTLILRASHQKDQR
jgi:hypothetical protein